MRRQDLLDDEIEVFAAPGAQALQIGLGIQEPVDVVDAQAVDAALLQQAQHQAVHVVKHFRQLHPHPGQLADVEEPAIVDVVGGDAEVGEPPVLVLDEGVELGPALGGLGVQRVQARLHRRQQVWPPLQGVRQLRLQGQGPAADLGAPFGKGGEVVAQPLQLRGGVAQQARIVQGTDRQLVRVVGPDGQAALVEVEPHRQLARLQHRAVMVAEEGDQQSALQVLAVGRPVDVEPAGEGRGGPPFQHAQPSGVARAADAHVVGHEVEDQLQALGVEGGAHPPEARLAA